MDCVKGDAWSPLYVSFAIYPSLDEKSFIASEIRSCCGQTASQALHPRQADGFFSSGRAPSAIGAINPPPE